MPPLWDMPSVWQFMMAVWLGIGGGLTAVGYLKSRELWQQRYEQPLLPEPEPPKLLPQRAQSRQLQRTRPPAPEMKTRPTQGQRHVTYPSRPTQGQRPASLPAQHTRTVPPVQQHRTVAQKNRRPATQPAVQSAPARRGPQWDD